MLKDHRIGLVLLMGGRGCRFQSSIPKQFHRLSGKPIYQVTLEALVKPHLIDEIILVCHENWLDSVQKEIQTLKIKVPIRVVKGGASRQTSSYLGLLAFLTPPSIVLIHDAVRPFISEETIFQNILNAIEYGAVDTCIPSNDTLVFSQNGLQIDSIPPRHQLLRGQTPQTFSYPLILKAHSETKLIDATDDCRLVLEMNHPVHIIKGDEHNIKITNHLDLFIAEQLFRLNMQSNQNFTPTNLSGKKIVIIGGTGGIGKVICEELKKLGACPIPLSRSTPYFSIDLKNSKSIESAFHLLGPIDGLINCAGFLKVSPLSTLSYEDIETHLDVNLKGLILACKFAQIKQGGHIINIASSSFTRGRKDLSLYSCAKAAVINFTQALSEERPDLKIHSVVPQRTKTPMRLENFPQEDLSSLLEPLEVAKAVISLLQDPYSTGLLIEVKKN